MSLQGSYALMLDLGESPEPDKLLGLYETLWQKTHLRGPKQLFSEFGPVPRGAMGQLLLASGQEISCYSRFEQDTLGYPTGVSSPVILSLGGFSAAPSSAVWQEIKSVLDEILQALIAVYPVRLAVLGHSSLYHVNARFISELWLDLHHALILSIWLRSPHPLLQKLQGSTDFHASYQQLQPADWRSCLSNRDEQEKYLSYKQYLAQILHSSKIQLNWE